MQNADSSSANALRGAALGGLGALLGAAAWAFAGGWIGAAGAIAAMTAVGWLQGAAVGRRNKIQRRDAAAVGSSAPKDGAAREPETVSERNADRDWRRVESGKARPSPMDEMSAQAKRDADWLEL